MLVLGMFVTACGVRLPNLNECVRNWPSVTIKNASAHDDPLAEGFTLMLCGQIVIFFSDLFMSVDWPRNLGQRVR